MSNVTVEKNTYKVDDLYQWDLNQELVIYGLSLPSIPEIHFTNAAMDRAIVRQATMDDAGVIRADIPNSLLQKPYKITAYVCIYEGETFESLYSIEIPVKPRSKPNDYTLEDDEEVYSFNALENLVNNTVRELKASYDSTIEIVIKTKNETINTINDVKDKAVKVLLSTPLAEFCDATVFAQIITDDLWDMSGFGVQGFAIGQCDGNNILVAGMTDNNANTGRLVSYNIDTGERLAYADGLNIGHCNGMTYCDKDGYFYIACSGGTNGVNKVSVYDKNLSFIKDIDFTGKSVTAPYGIAYSSKTETFYVVVGGGKIAEMDYNFEVIRTVKLVVQNNTGCVSQSIFVDENYLYYITNDLSVKDGTYNKFDIYHLDTLEFFRKQYVLTKGELEACCFFKNELYMLHNSINAGIIYKGNPYNTSDTFSKLSVNVNACGLSLSTDIDDYWIDTTYTGFFVDNTEEKPFNRFYHATDYVRNVLTQYLQFNIKGELTHNINIKHLCKNLAINGIAIDGVKPKIKGIALYGIPSVTMSNIELTGRNSNDNSLLYMRACGWTWIDKVDFNGLGTEDRGIAVFASHLTFRNCNFISKLNYYIYAKEGATVEYSGTNTFQQDALFYVPEESLLPYHTKVESLACSLNNITCLEKVQDFDITKIRKDGKYRIEYGSVSVNVPPELQTGGYYFTVKTYYDDGTYGAVRYEVLKANGQRYVGIYSVEQKEITWKADYDIAVSFTSESVINGTIYAVTQDLNHIAITSTFTANADITAGTVLATLDDIRFIPRENEYYLPCWNGDTWKRVSIVNNQIIAIDGLSAGTCHINGMYFGADMKYKVT